MLDRKIVSVSIVSALACLVLHSPAALAQREARTIPRNPESLILDLKGDGIDLQSEVRTRGPNGRMAPLRWTKKGTDDAFLMLDATALRAAGVDVREAGRPVQGITTLRKGLETWGDPHVYGDVWDRLRAFDANKDGIINASDPVFSHLRLWLDADGDGIAGAGELRGLAEEKIVGISLGEVSAPRADPAGNTFRDGAFLRADGTRGVIRDASLAAAAPAAEAAPPD
jgi:hypothetical protein